MKKEQLPIRFTLTKIKTEQFACYEELYDSNKSFDITSGFQCKLNHDQQKVGVFFDVDFSQKKKQLIRLEISCHFHIEDKSWGSLVEKEQMIIPKDFLTHLAVVTLGTARGILHVKLEGTLFSGFVLPLFNVTEMISEPAIFPLNSDE
jgi:hypothetical protein